MRSGHGSTAPGGFVSFGAVGPIAYTPTVTWAGNTITTQSGFYMKLPGLLLVWVSFVESAGTASATLTITIPTGYTAVTLIGSLAAGVGTIGTGPASASIVLSAAAGATTSIATANAAQGAVATWSGMFVIPTIT